MSTIEHLSRNRLPKSTGPPNPQKRRRQKSSTDATMGPVLIPATTTALLKVTNDVVMFAGDQLTTVLLSLDISASAAFDTNHKILIECICQDFGIHGTTFNWLRSFVSDRSQYVAVGAEQSSSVNCTSGVPQGSVLGPLLFAMYISPDTQLYGRSIE